MHKGVITIRPYNIRLEYGRVYQDAVCIIESEQPEISWALAGISGSIQTAFRIIVKSEEKVLWDTGWVKSTSQHVKYAGEKLLPGEIYTLSIQVKDEQDKISDPELCRFCPGRLSKWPAEWLCERDEKEDGVISFIKDIRCDREIASACLFIATLGYHKVYINGHNVFTRPMNPAVSEYQKRAYYTVLPGLEKVLTKGYNRVGINVAAGWRSPHHVCYKLFNRVAEFAGETQMSAVLRIRYEDGNIEWINTDSSWRYFYGGTVYSNIFMGEKYEAQKAMPDWSVYGTLLKTIEPVVRNQPPSENLVPQTLEPICEQEIYPALTVNEVAPGVYGVDFGQNIAGVCRIRIPKSIRRGECIQIRHMEALDDDGRLYLPQLRGAASIDIYIASGDSKDLSYWQPDFTYHGFRYAEISGYPVPLLREDICAVSLYTDVKSKSMFTTGNALINAIQKNIVQTEKANIHSILTDCPQRDERQGWLNDATPRFEETPYNFDIGRLFPKVVRDIMDVQDKEGAITCTAPFVFGCRPADPVCSSYLIAGWESYMHTGNVDILREAFDGFAAWNDYLLSKSENYIVQYSYYGDWAAPAYACDREDGAVSGVTPGIFMSTGYFYFNACLLAKMAEAIGRDIEAKRHREISEKIKEAFLEKWWDAENGRVATGSQGCQTFALWLDILPPEGRQIAADYLRKDLIDRNYMITTGNLCTRYLFDVLTRFGYVDDAYTLITREEYPSIGFMIQNEATTVWERFELKKNPAMNSHNHPMYGSVGYWFYAYLAGVKPTKPGFEEFSVKPYIPKKLMSLNAAVPTPFGDITVRWVKRYGKIWIYVGVPHGTKANVSLPWGPEHIVGQGFYQWSNAIDHF